MTLLAVANPLPTFLGLNGLAINNGHLYIGLPNMDPETDPQPVFWDQAGTIPASQPLDVQGGYVMYLGAPAIFYTDQPFSIRIRNAAGSQVFYLASASATSGGGGGQQVFANIAALRASVINPDNSMVEGYYAAGDNGGGQFILDPSDTTSPDDGAVVIVDANGNRHKRQWSGWFNLLWAGAVGDGATDNASAINRFCYLARQASDAGNGFNLLVPPGHYNWNMATTGYYWLAGIKNLVISGYGATFQNTYAGGDGNLRRPWSLTSSVLWNQTGATFHGVVAGAPMSWLINNTTVGATSFTTTTPADAGVWSAGSKVLLTSVDIQWLGYPPNPDHFEYHTVVSSDPATGIVVVDRPIQYQHLTTYPDGGVVSSGAGSAMPVGRGRAWAIEGNQTGIVDPLNAPSTVTMFMPFGIDHKFLGLTINQTSIPTATYMAISGERTEWIDCTLIGISPTVADLAIFRGCTFTEESEPDKMVTRVVLDNCSSGSAINFQSSSISYVDVTGGYYANFGVGSAKYVTITNPDMDQLTFSSVYGPNRSCTITGGSVRVAAGMLYDFSTNPDRQITGVDITYAAGVISVLKQSFFPFAYWGLVPGDQLNLCTTASAWSGDAGTGIVTSLTEDATNVKIGVSWPWANLAACPFAHDGKLRVFRVGSIQVHNTTGCDNIRNMAEATRRGKRHTEFYGAQMVNFNTASGDAVGSIFGELTNFNINVQQVTSTATRTLVFSTYLVKADTLDDQKLLVITIALTKLGKRKLDLVGFTGLQTGDTVTFDGSPVTELPPTRIISSGPSWAHNITVPGTSATIPVVVWEAITDGGMYGSTLIRNLDRTTNPVTNVAGLVPS